MSHAIQHVAFAANYLFLQQHSKVVKPTKRSKSTTEPTVKSSFVTYLLECFICNIQCVGKSETPFRNRLNNYRKDVKNPDAIPACKHFNRHSHDFKNHKKIIIIKQLRNIGTISTET